MKYIILLGIALTLFSCQPSIKEGVVSSHDITSIPLQPEEERAIRLTDITKKIKLVPLETMQASILADIEKIDYDAGRYFISSSHDKLVYVFDTLGNFSCRIGTKGKGPGEIQYPGPFALNKLKKEVWIDNNSLWFYKYDYDGNFEGNIDNKRRGISCRDFYIHRDSLIYITTSKYIVHLGTKNEYCWDLWIKQPNGEYQTFFPFSAEVYGNGAMHLFTNTNFSTLSNSVTFHYSESDTIYSIVDGSVLPQYVVDFGKRKTNRDLTQLAGNDLIEFMLTSSDAYHVHNVIETTSVLYFCYFMKMSPLEKGQPYTAIYHKKSGIIQEGRLQNDIFGCEIMFYLASDNQLIGLAQPQDIKLAETSLLDNNSIAMLEKISGENNPILVKIELKDL